MGEQDNASKPINKSAVKVADSIKRLKRAMAEVPKTAPASDTSDARIQEMIQRLKSLSLPDKPIERGAEIVPKKQQPTTRPSGPVTEQAVKPKGVPKEILDRIKKIPPSQAVDPLFIGDAMFNDGELEIAAVFYSLALERKLENRTRAWVLYQLGNCQAAKDPSAALASYKEVAAKYPKVLWAELAAVQIQMTEWRISAKPEELLKRIRTDPAYKPAGKKSTSAVSGSAGENRQPTTRKSDRTTGDTAAGSTTKTR